MLAWWKPEDMKFADHMMVWSRMEFLMTFGDQKLAMFVDAIKGRQDARGNSPTKDQILTIQREALQKAWGLDPKGFDEQWKKWAMAKYPAK